MSAASQHSFRGVTFRDMRDYSGSQKQREAPRLAKPNLQSNFACLLGRIQTHAAEAWTIDFSERQGQSRTHAEDNLPGTQSDEG